MKRKRSQFFESSFQKNGSILWLIFQKKIFNSLSHIDKKINSVSHIVKKVHRKRFNSMGHFWKRVLFFALYSKKVQFIDSFFVFLKRKTVQVFESRKEQIILWVIYFVKFKYSVSHTKKWVQFFGSYQKSVQFFDSYVFKNLILRVIFFKKVNSLSHFLNKNLWVVWKKV